MGCIHSRKTYIQDITKVYFIQQHNLGKFFVLQSFPFSWEPDICLIYAHNIDVADILHENIGEIFESNIFIISCLQHYKDIFLVDGKNIYICPQDEGYVNLRYGHLYGFDFDITDVELNLYNSPYKTITEKLSNSFILLE